MLFPLLIHRNITFHTFRTPGRKKDKGTEDGFVRIEMIPKGEERKLRTLRNPVVFRMRGVRRREGWGWGGGSSGRMKLSDCSHHTSLSTTGPAGETHSWPAAQMTGALPKPWSGCLNIFLEICILQSVLPSGS